MGCPRNGLQEIKDVDLVVGIGEAERIGWSGKFEVIKVPLLFF